VIDAEAKNNLDRWIAMMAGQQRVRFRWDASRTLPAVGTFVPPTIVILDRAGDLQQEVFGPILHVVRWRANELDPLLDEIAANGYGLTLGIHTRIDSMVEHIAARLATGNVYVNRNMIGAVVGTQPFGGTGLSGRRVGQTTSGDLRLSRSSRSIPRLPEAMLRCSRQPKTEPRQGSRFCVLLILIYFIGVDALAPAWSILIRNE
jgi:RHH-type proline utilization regulon transcriptional repressor/proline dehydrogenase/delta 1-pyrroline-5-carboxylate dehydrogenase